jgi:polyhydroxyalkanoate synthesis regulator phasin
MKEIIKSILSMVNDGKITAEEGVKLINAVKFTYNPSYERAKKMKNSVKKAVRDAEPKVKKAAEIIWDKSVEAAKGVKMMAGDITEKLAATKDKKSTYKFIL